MIKTVVFFFQGVLYVFFSLDRKETKGQGCMEWTKNKFIRLKSNKRASLERNLIFTAHFICFTHEI
ncbi:hypothetical protein A9P82_05815 [Arachidicoccus ginsenosidimutans]|nr:hypothetical protein A9P82_05815 [Arachidicoccus sp. BS20]